MKRISTATALMALVGVVLALGGCSDPNDPRTWAKKLKDLREQKEALNNLANMDVERAKVALPELIALYKETKSPEHLRALVRYKDERTIPLFIEALEFSPDEFDRAIIAAEALGQMKAKAAVEPLAKAAETPLPIKSRANAARVEALRALVLIGDPRAVPTLVKILTTSSAEQDFLLNQKAALGLAEFRDPASIPALLKGLFMEGRGIDTSQECRLALVRIGEPSVGPLVELLNEKNAEVSAQTKHLKPGVVPLSAAWVLGDLRSPKAVPPLLARLKRTPGLEHGTVLIALGKIGGDPAVDALVETVKDPKAKPELRASAAEGLYLSGDRRSVPVLLDVAKTGYIVTPEGKASDLRASAAVGLARIAGKEHYDAFKTLVDAETEVEGIFGEALDRMQVAKECGDDVACYGKMLADPSWTRAEKAAYAIGFSGKAKEGLPLLLDALKPVASLPQDRYLVHSALLFAITRLGGKSCASCEDRLVKQIERDEKAVRLPGARGLLGETRVALAVIQNKS